MDRYTEETVYWLDLRFDTQVYQFLGRAYDPYQPLQGIAADAWNPIRFLMAARLVRLMSVLESIRPASFLDIGGAEGLVAKLVADGCGAHSVSVDLSHQAALRASEYCAVDAAAADSARLPFPDQSFDVVFLSEVLEHLANPVRSLLEAKRVARRALIVTTEAFAPNEEERRRELAERVLEPHMDRSIFCAADFGLIMAPLDVRLANQAARLPARLPTGPADFAALIGPALEVTDIAWPAHGIVVVVTREKDLPIREWTSERALAQVRDLLAPQTRVPRTLADGPVSPSLLAVLVCPVCQVSVAPVDDTALECTSCHARYPVSKGVPKMLTAPGLGFPESLEARLQREFPGDAESRQRILELDALMKFDLPRTVDEVLFLEEGLGEFEVGKGVELLGTTTTGKGVFLRARQEDPMLISPRLRIPMAKIRGFRVKVACHGSSRKRETVQIYLWTLKRPVWWELGSVLADYEPDGKMREFILATPPHLDLVPDDELLRLRFDPGHGSGTYEILGLEILPKEA